MCNSIGFVLTFVDYDRCTIEKGCKGDQTRGD